MNKSSQYNQQQTEPKQCKSEVEELRIQKNLETGRIAASVFESKYKKIVGSMLERISLKKLYSYIW